jgi:hypothetical protein
MKRSSVNMLIDDLIIGGLIKFPKRNHKAYLKIKDQAIRLFKEQIIESYMAGSMENVLDYQPNKNSLEYYKRMYECDLYIEDNVSDKIKYCEKKSGININSFKPIKKNLEISDDEIEEYADNLSSYIISKDCFMLGMMYYREELKKRQ